MAEVDLSALDLSALAWRKSSASFADGCVTVAVCEGRVMVRDTRDISAVTLAFPCRDWNIFLRQVNSNVSCQDHATS